MHRRPAIALALLLVAALPACGGDSAGPGGELPEGYAADPTDLTLLLRFAYESMEVGRLEKLLHPEFRFELDPADRDTLGFASSVISRDSTLDWTACMFAGHAGFRAYGTWQAPVDTFPNPIGGTFFFDQDEEDWWTVPGGEFAGDRVDTMQVAVSCNYVNGDFDLMQNGARLVVRPRALSLPGNPVAWQIVQWVDIRPGNVAALPRAVAGGAHSLSFGRWWVKFRFGDPPPPDS